MTVKLITEQVEDVEVLKEEDEKSGKKNYKLKGIFLQGDIKNRNGRIYPVEVLEKEVDRYNKEFIAENRGYGELGHPEGPTVNLERVSHMVTSLKRDGKNFVGEAKVMSTPMGKIVENIMDDGGKLAVSSRGMGSLQQKNGANYVNKDFYLATAADIVADPSAPQAFVQGVMEGKEWIWDNGIIREAQIDSYRSAVQSAKSKEMESTKLGLFEDFFEKLSKN